MQPVPLIIFIHAQDKLTFHSFIICYIFYFHSTSIFWDRFVHFLQWRIDFVPKEIKIGSFDQNQVTWISLELLFMYVCAIQEHFLCYFDKMFFCKRKTLWNISVNTRLFFQKEDWLSAWLWQASDWVWKTRPRKGSAKKTINLSLPYTIISDLCYLFEHTLKNCQKSSALKAVLDQVQFWDVSLCLRLQFPF